MPKRLPVIETVSEAQRLDKWLWYARVTKTRTLASTLVQNGKVRVNRGRTDKPGYSVKIDDVITIAVHGMVRVLKIKAPGKRRGPASEAAELFEDLTPPPIPQDPTGETDGLRARGDAVPGGARPTKRDRRVIDRFRNVDPD